MPNPYFARSLIVYSLFIPSQPVNTQPDAVLKPYYATLFFFRITKDDKNLHLCN